MRQRLVITISWLETFLSRVSAMCILLIMLATTADVAGRYLFNSPIPGVYEASQLMMVGIVFLAIPYVQSVRGHVRVDLILTKLPPKARKALDIFACLLGLLIFAIVTWKSGAMAWVAVATGEYAQGLIHIPVWPAKVAFPIGTGLLCLQFMVDIVKIAAGAPVSVRVGGEK